jgi:hypothetical protein
MFEAADHLLPWLATAFALLLTETFVYWRTMLRWRPEARFLGYSLGVVSTLGCAAGWAVGTPYAPGVAAVFVFFVVAGGGTLAPALLSAWQDWSPVRTIRRHRATLEARAQHHGPHDT